MQEISVVVKSETGMHARPASLLVSKTAKYKCNIVVKKGDKEANLKSLLGLLSLGVVQNDQITIHTEGEDEVQAMETIKQCGKQFGLW